MAISSKEWFDQSDYDFQTAKAMFDSGRYIYSVFMCHLAIEKCLKGIFVETTGSIPPKSHNLFYFIDRLNLSLEKELEEFLTILNDQGIATRYPESLMSLVTQLSKKRTERILGQTNKVLKWIISQSSK